MFDARGFGDSDKPTDPDAYDFRTKVFDAVAVMNELGVEQAHLFGYSMGAMTAISAAIYAPQRFRSLIIGGHSPRGAVDSTAINRDWEAAWHGTDGLPAISSRPGADHDVMKANFTMSGRFGGGIQVLKTTNLPFLLFAGELDEGPFSGQSDFAAKYGANVFSLPGKGHVEAADAVDLVAPRVIEFIQRVEAD